MSRTTLSCCVLLALCVLAGSTVRPAAAQDRKLAITSLDDVDDDFAFQGEYLGNAWRADRWCGCQTLGLQVVARGKGQFVASAYWGGLPGYSCCRQDDRMDLKGSRDGDEVRLAGDEFVVVLRDGASEVRTTSEAGETLLGQLRKTRRQSSTLGARPPCGATVLFDGSGTEHFKNGRMTDDGLLMVGTEIEKAYGDFYMHLEFRLPYMPYATGQGRANSGVYLQSRYELQILDSFGLEGKNNECGGLYKYREPDVNMCLPPLSWQTYDIQFTSPRFYSSGEKVCNARLTVWHNGVVIHDDVSVERKTGAGAKEEPKLLPTKLQNHGNPVHFRNIWIVDHGEPPTYQPCRCYACRQ